MATPLLIVTPQSSFGTNIRKGLNTGRYNVVHTADFSEAIQFVRNMNCLLAILDAEMDNIDISILDIGIALRQINPGIQFVIVNGPGQDAQVEALMPITTLSKPISFPDLENALEKPVAAPVVKTVEPAASDRLLAETTSLMWLKDVSRAAQHLTRLTLESSAQAALITRKNELWAYAGQLSREAAQELASSLQRYWDGESESDLLRFVRLEATEAQHMLYARKLSNTMLLALVFDAETPFSTIRTQASKLVRTLAENNPFETAEKPAPAVALPTPVVVTGPEPVESLPAAENLAAPENLPPVEEIRTAAEEEPDENDIPHISDLLGDVPPPIPPRPITAPRQPLPWEMPKPLPLQPQPVMAKDEPKTTPPPQWAEALHDAPALTSFSRETSPAVRMGNGKLPKVEAEAGSFAPTALNTETRTDQIPDDLAVTRKHEVGKDPETLVETRPQAISESVTEVAHRILLEPASPELVNLTYACLLVPRFDVHHLIGDVSDKLAEWVPNFCIAYGWRLEYLAVRPEYLQWVVRVPPSTAPGFIMRIIRQQTSERLFKEFPKFKVDNIGSDFWAPGYLIMGSSQAHPQKLVREFIRQTRDRQGIVR